MEGTPDHWCEGRHDYIVPLARQQDEETAPLVPARLLSAPTRAEPQSFPSILASSSSDPAAFLLSSSPPWGSLDFLPRVTPVPLPPHS